MKKWLLVLPLMALVPLRATADDSLVRFDGGIGVDPISGIVSNAPALNVVRGVPPGGFPWVIKRLRADVQSDGRIHVDGRGLLFAGGNAIGTNGGQRVLALLFCGRKSGKRHGPQLGSCRRPSRGEWRLSNRRRPDARAACPVRQRCAVDRHAGNASLVRRGDPEGGRPRPRSEALTRNVRPRSQSSRAQRRCQVT